jgi:hypothetical protein
VAQKRTLTNAYAVIRMLKKNIYLIIIVQFVVFVKLLHELRGLGIYCVK